MKQNVFKLFLLLFMLGCICIALDGKVISNVYAKSEETTFIKYALTEDQLVKIARLCQQEQGSVIGAKAEASLMANQLETSLSRQKKYGTGPSGLYNWVRNGGWFAKAAYWMDKGSVTNAVLEGVRDVLVNGNRTLPQFVDEHDCLSDIKSISTGKVTNKSAYIQGVTSVNNRYGSRWTFWCFPDGTSDPFGYTAAAYKYVMEKTISKPDIVFVKAYSTESSSSIKINWNASSGATSYRVDRWEANTDNTYTVVKDGVAGTSYTDTGLKPNTQYWYRIHAVNAAGVSDFNHETSDILASTSVPAKVRVKSYSTESTTSIKINWETSIGAKTYQVDRWEANTDNTYTVVKSGITGTSYTDTELKPNTQYWYRVRAVNGAGFSLHDHETSDILATTTVVGVPTGVTVTGISATSITASWDPTPGAASYRIFRWQAWKGDTTATDVETAFVGTSYTDTGLLPGTQYYYRIYANSEKGQSTYSPQVRGTTFCDVPTGVQAIGDSTTSITVSWDPTPGATSYRIFRWQAWKGDMTAMDIEKEYEGTSYTDNDLLPGTQYYYRIYANNEGGQSGYSKEVIASTVFAPDYILPLGVQRIEKEAMNGLPVTMIQCPEGLETIGERAFAECWGLTAIYIPDTTTSIAMDAFEGCEDLTIWGMAGSTAQQYARDNGYAFKSIVK